MNDADVPAFSAGLGLPGIFDVHVHFMHPRMMAKVWAYFDGAGSLPAGLWPVQYRGTDHERVDHLRSMGVRRFTSL